VVKRAALLLLLLACGCTSTRPQYVASRGGVREITPKEPATEPNFDGIGQALVQIGNCLASGCCRH